MLKFLKDHPFPVEAFFERSIVLTFAVDMSEVRDLIPECLELDIFDDQCAFIAVALVQTRDLRPKGSPAIFGSDFFLIGYRVFVRYTQANGKRIRGLYILGSQTNSKQMEIVGNLFTHYRYSTVDIKQEMIGPRTRIVSKKAELNIVVDDVATSLPAGSPFRNWKEARRFAGPLPFTFTYDSVEKRVLIVEGVREDWHPQPLKVVEYKVGFLDGLGISDHTLAAAFSVSNIPYHWKKGRVEKWTG